jgi:hypothetical protein
MLAMTTKDITLHSIHIILQSIDIYSCTQTIRYSTQNSTHISSKPNQLKVITPNSTYTPQNQQTTITINFNTNSAEEYNNN